MAELGAVDEASMTVVESNPRDGALGFLGDLEMTERARAAMAIEPERIGAVGAG